LEEIAEKIELRATDSNLSESEFDLSSTAETLEESVSVPDFQAQLVSCRLKPKPNATVEDVGAAQILNESCVLTGQLISFFFVIALGAALWQNQLFSIGVMAFTTPIILSVLVLVFTFVFVKLKMRLGLELLGGLIYPPSFLNRTILRTLSFLYLGEGMQSRNKYIQASVCFAELLRIYDPLEVVEKYQLRERDYLYSLVYADKLGEALAYSDKTVEFAEYLVSTADRPATSNYYAFATCLSGQIYELAGESEKANSLRDRCYQSSLRSQNNSASQLFGLYAKAEELFSKANYSEACNYFQRFVTASVHYAEVSKCTIYMSKAYLNYSVCLAHLDRIDDAYKMFEVGKKRLQDFATFSNAEIEFAAAELCFLEGKRDHAVDILKKVRKTLEFQNCSFLDRRQRQLLRAQANFRIYEKPFDESCFSRSESGEIVSNYRLDDEHREVLSGLWRLFCLLGLMSWYFITTPLENLPAILMLVFLLIGVTGFCLYIYLQSKKNVRWAEIALNKGIPCLVKVKFTGGYNDVAINCDRKYETYTIGNTKLKQQATKIMSDQEFDAVAFRLRGKDGDLSALQVFGQTASITKKQNWLLPR
ncbi:MAG: hypothetical protein IAF58_03405, partial [Leptolyngbya sp.]|nr:hypothetical protein [Candidatus Melainabacteria bacterium]